MKNVAIFGAAGLGSLVHDILLQSGQYRPVAFLDSDARLHGTMVAGLPVLGGFEELKRLPGLQISDAVVAIGENAPRVAVATALKEKGLNLVSAIHPLASISHTASLGEHLIIGARTTICVHASVGAHCVLSAGSILEHDNRLGVGVFLHPAVRLAGTVTIDDGATLGIGACVIPGRRVGREARVEPGAVVIRDVAPGATVGGVPAREWYQIGRAHV